MIWKKRYLSEFGNNVYRCRDINSALLWCLAFKMLYYFTEGNYNLKEVEVFAGNKSKRIYSDEIGTLIRTDSRVADCFMAIFRSSDRISFSAAYKEKPFQINLILNSEGRITEGALFDFESSTFTIRELKNIVEIIDRQGENIRPYSHSKKETV